MVIDVTNKTVMMLYTCNKNAFFIFQMHNLATNSTAALCHNNQVKCANESLIRHGDYAETCCRLMLMQYK